MATVLDFSILNSLSVVFIFIAVYVASWGLFTFVNPFNLKDDGQKKIYGVLSFALTFILILSPTVVGLVSFSIPWLAVIVMVGFFMLFFARMFHPELDASGLIGRPVVYGFLIFFTALVLIFGLAASFGQGLLESQPGVADDADAITGQTSPTDQFVPADEADTSGSPDDPYAPGGTVDTSGSQQSAASNSFGANLILTLFHPKILGMLFMLLLATITVLLLAQ